MVVIGCDPDEDRQKRLRALLRHTGVRCDRAPEGTAAQEFPLAAPRGHSLFVRDRGRVLFGEETPGVVPLVDGVVAAVSSGAGAFVVLGSTSVLSNDGLTEADNALFIASLMRRHIVVDERHHLTRGAAAVQKAAQKGPGPVTALVCLLLLIPLTLLGFSPRRGELMTSDDDLAIPAGEARVRGLAALLHGDMK